MAKERWITVNGNHILIKDGKSVKETLTEHFGDKKGKKRINKGKYEYSMDGDKWENMDKDSYSEMEADEDEFDQNEDSDFDIFENEDFDVGEDDPEFTEAMNKEPEGRWKELTDKKDEFYDFLKKEVGSAGEERNLSKSGEQLSKEWQEALINKYNLSPEEAYAVSRRTMGFANAPLEVLAKGYKKPEEEAEPNPMDEFSGPSQEGPSYAQMDAMIENAFKNGQTPQQVVDSVKYDLDIQDGSPELKELMDKVRNYKKPEEPETEESLNNQIKELRKKQFDLRRQYNKTGDDSLVDQERDLEDQIDELRDKRWNLRYGGKGK